MNGGMIGVGRAAVMASVVLLTGCGSTSGEGQGLAASLRQAAGQIATRSTGQGDGQTTPPPSPEAMAAEALRVNPGPLILVEFENLGRTQVLALTGENQGMRTYMTESKEAIILRSGLVIGTRGLGNDLGVAEIGTEGLIRARSTGTGTRLMRALQGDGREHALPLRCTVSAEKGPVVERCENGALNVENRYVVTAGGSVSASRQWLGPRLGYVTVQTIRP